MKVENMKNHKGNVVKNQFIIHDVPNNFTHDLWRVSGEYGPQEGILFQSYQSNIAYKVNGKVFLDRTYWDYSATTGKYRNIFLNEDKRTTEQKIKSGAYILTNLNQ